MTRIQSGAAFLVVLLISGASLAAGQPMATPRTVGSAIEWQLLTDGERVLLSVSAPDGRVYAHEFTGHNPLFRLQELGKDIVDGAYTYELRLVPKISAEVRARLAAARTAGDEDLVRRIQKDAGVTETLVQAGGFRVSGGTIVPLDAVETTAQNAKPDTTGSAAGGSVNSTSHAPARLTPVTNTQVIPDNLVVQGSECVGLDCIAAESFGFDTIRLKENNLRIKFEDTSVGSFPSVDWQITANDSSSGGPDKFSIDDVTNSRTPFTILANAPTNSLFVSSSGRLGVRTGTPVLDVHVKSGDTPAHRFEQDSTGGFTAQTWDIGANEANFFVRDVTGGSRLPFRIRPGAPTSTIDIAGTGFVGVGTANPQRKMHIVGASGPVPGFPAAALGAADSLVIDNNGNTNVAVITSAGGNGTLRFVRDSSPMMNGWVTYIHSADAMSFGTASAERLRIDSQGRIGLGVAAPANPIEHSSGARLTAGGAWINASSCEFKQDIEQLGSREATKALSELDPVKYVYKADPTERHVGFIAEDVPELVATGDRKGLSALDVVAVLTKVVQDQQKTIDQLQQRLDALEKRQLR